MRKYFLLPHLGLGDQFLMNGFVHYLRNTFFPDEIMIVCKAPQLKTLQELYQEYPIVKLKRSNADQNPDNGENIVDAILVAISSILLN